MINVRTTSPTGQEEWVTLPLTRKSYKAVRATIKELHDVFGHWGGLGKSDTWHATCSVQSEAQALIVRNADRFPAEIVALVKGEGEEGLKRMMVLYALTNNNPKIRKIKMGYRVTMCGTIDMEYIPDGTIPTLGKAKVEARAYVRRYGQNKELMRYAISSINETTKEWLIETNGRSWDV